MATDFSKKINKNSICTTFLLGLLFFLFYQGYAEAQMSSGAYKIPVDSINVGGNQSGSGLYNLLDSAGEVGTGESGSSTYKLNAGFIGAQQVYLAISAPTDVAMTPSISGVSGGTGTGSIAWTVTTDNFGGYSMFVHSSTTPTLRSVSSDFTDYTPAGSDPDYNWNVASTDSEFGVTAEGLDIDQFFKDNGSACNTGSSDTADKCWYPVTTSDLLVSKRTSGNHPSGTATTLKIQAEVGSSHIQPNGTYNSTITATVIAL
jgi:hypothetical protein